MRRFLSSLLAIIVLVLSCIPCNDADAMPAQSKEATVKAATTTGDNTNSPTDTCTPFCICSCCAGFALPATAFGIRNNPTVYAAKAFAAHPSAAIIQVALPVWQPPQLA